MSKCVPDMMVNNVIWGEKYLMWHGTVAISCDKNNYVAKIRFSEEDYRNLVEGDIFDGETLIYHLSGFAGQKTYIKDISKNETEEKLFVDISTFKESTVFYPPEEVRDEFNSIRLWMPVKEAIIKNDMAVADEEKRKLKPINVSVNVLGYPVVLGKIVNILLFMGKITTTEKNSTTRKKLKMVTGNLKIISPLTKNISLLCFKKPNKLE